MHVTSSGLGQEEYIRLFTSHLTFQQKGNRSSQASKSIKTEHFYYTNFPLDDQTRQAFGP